MTEQIKPPAGGETITIANGKLDVPANPIIPFIEGDGTGPDIWRASRARVRRGRREGLRRQAQDRTGWKSRRREGVQPDRQLAARRDASRRSASTSSSIKGPLTTPVGGGIRSLNVALRQMLDLYVCLRPVRWFTGVPSPVKDPEKVDMMIFRENTEDIYAGIEFEAGTADAKKFAALLKENFPERFKKMRFPDDVAASASSRSRAKAPSGSCAPRSSTPSTTSARR